ncbi:hypothetical protein [Curvivirga aplysinae]|uniref:hypothetical protein n=1 Tax=Curvivirga aplysinae TaxID=2529852 RepID=UPI0012BD817B|nr:hypothetical protein [Curvivirga aplysinae]MTI10826.1 hypothetical protein [Curvivirga aplysinae]
MLALFLLGMGLVSERVKADNAAAMTIVIPERDRERFRKVVLVMKTATVEGEKAAAEQAALRLAKQWDMTLEEAIAETHPELDDGKVNESEQAARRQSAVDAWASGTLRMMRGNEAREKYEFQMAAQAARERGMKEEMPVNQPKSGNIKITRTFHSSYKPTKADHERLIGALLKEGHNLRKTAILADATSQQVASVYLKMRDEITAARKQNAMKQKRAANRRGGRR